MQAIPMQSLIDFEPIAHIYTLNGQRLPSVTQIMTPMSIMVYTGIPSDIMASAADRGTRVHEQVSNYIKFGYLEVDEDTEQYVAAYISFAEAYKPVWQSSEIRRLLMAITLISLLSTSPPRFSTRSMLPRR